MPTKPSGDKPANSRYDDVLEVGTSLFSEHGYRGTTVRMISDELGILSGSLYSHISTKEDILRAVALKVGTAFLSGAEEAVADATSPAEGLRAICESHLRVLDDQLTAVTVYYNEWHRLAPAAQEEIVELRDRYEALITAQVAAGIEQGEFVADQDRIGVLAILSLLNWTYQWYNPEGDAGPTRLAKLYTDVVFNGLRRRD